MKRGQHFQLLRAAVFFLRSRAPSTLESGEAGEFCLARFPDKDLLVRRFGLPRKVAAQVLRILAQQIEPAAVSEVAIKSYFWRQDGDFGRLEIQAYGDGAGLVDVWYSLGEDLWVVLEAEGEPLTWLSDSQVGELLARYEQGELSWWVGSSGRVNTEELLALLRL